MDLVRAPDGGGRGLGKAEIEHLARLDQVSHGTHGFFDGYVLVHPVLIVEIDVVHPQTHERVVARLLHVVGPPTDAKPCAVLAAYIAELGRDDHVFAPSR